MSPNSASGRARASLVRGSGSRSNPSVSAPSPANVPAGTAAGANTTTTSGRRASSAPRSAPGSPRYSIQVGSRPPAGADSALVACSPRRPTKATRVTGAARAARGPPAAASSGRSPAHPHRACERSLHASGLASRSAVMVVEPAGTVVGGAPDPGGPKRDARTAVGRRRRP